MEVDGRTTQGSSGVLITYINVHELEVKYQSITRLYRTPTLQIYTLYAVRN